MAFAEFTEKLLIIAICLVFTTTKSSANDILGCGGFVKSHVSLDYSKIEIGLYTKEGSLKEKTECAPTNGYYFLPLYEKGEYVLKVHPPAGWSFEPSVVELSVDGVSDRCSTGQDINFAFNGFGITGKVITAGQTQGPSGIAVLLVNDKGEERKTVTTVGGDFHFTPVIPGQYILKAAHPRWKLDPAQAVVQVKEGNTALPVGVLAVKGYDVSGSITSFGSSIGNIYVLLYSKEESPKFRVEGCKTALLQGVPDAPICHVTTDGSGQFSFGLVPAGEYKLRVMSTTPGLPSISYNVKPEVVPFTVRHDSLFIKNAFEVTGFTVIGSVQSTADKGLSGVRVSLDGTPVGKTDASGKYTLTGLIPAVYTVSFQHEKCEIEDVQLSVESGGPRALPPARVARWRVCGTVSPAPAHARHVALASRGTPDTNAIVAPDAQGKWCTFLPPGTYSAKVEVSEQEQSEGLQFYPLTQKVTVVSSPVDSINFSQLKGTLTGTIVCKKESDCASIPVTLRPLSPDGGYVGQPLYATAVAGKYKFEEVLPGSVEISVSSDRLCWKESKHIVAVTQTHADVPAFHHTGYVLKMQSSHEHEVEYSSASSSGVFKISAGASSTCVGEALVFTLTPRGCHTFQPPQAVVDVAKDTKTVVFVAVAHAVTVTVTSPAAVSDLVLTVSRDRGGVVRSDPLPHVKDAGMYVYTYTLHMTEGEVATVSAFSSSLLFSPMEPQQLVGVAQCQPDALTLRARAALTLRGQIVPPVADVTLTLTADDVKLSQVTTSEGTYSFGPLDASKSYKIVAEKESYVFSEPDDKGQIKAHKLAEIIVNLVDDADNTPLQAALVSVSGGSYRRNAASPASGSLRFSSLSPGEYYIKPNMKEFRFSPLHHILQVEEGKVHTLTLRGSKVASSCMGALVSLGGAGWARAALQAVPAASASSHCATEDALTNNDGTFRIRGLLPECTYSLVLKESASPDLQGLKLAKAPTMLEVKDNKDITGVMIIAVQPTQLTDSSVLVHAHLDHYRTLRLLLAPDSAPDSPIYSTKLDPAGYSQQMNPGLMYVLPRLPADNKTYVLSLESTLSKATHSYSQQAFYFNSDGKYKHFNIEFLPKVKSSEQELRQTSLLVIPLLGILAFLYSQRWRLAALLPALAALRPAKATSKAPRPDVLDKASIDHILNTVNPPKKAAKKKPAFL